MIAKVAAGFIFCGKLTSVLPLQEEDAVLAEMEFTGQAFEEMQEQNVRLLQQLREKDDANLKLMSEVTIEIQRRVVSFPGPFISWDQRSWRRTYV